MLLSRRSGPLIGNATRRTIASSKLPSSSANHSTYTDAQNRATTTSSSTTSTVPRVTGVSRAWDPPNPLPATFLRGGTSKGIFINQTNLPSLIPPSTSMASNNQSKTDDANYATWKKVLLGIMGSPDPEHGRQLNGMGGGVSSLSKVVLVRPVGDWTPETKKLKEEGVHVEYTFVQVGIRDDAIDIEGNCGNLSSTVGVFALDEGMVQLPEDGTNPMQGKGRGIIWKDEDTGRWYATIKAYNTNTKKVVQTTFPVEVEGAEITVASQSPSSSTPPSSSSSSTNIADAEAGVTPFTTTSPHVAAHTPTSTSTTATPSDRPTPTTASSSSSSSSDYGPSVVTPSGTTTTPANHSPTATPTTSYATSDLRKAHTERQAPSITITPLLSLPQASIAGVPGKASQIDLEFLNPAGARTGKLLPHNGQVVTDLVVESTHGKQTIPASLVDASNPTVFVNSSHLGPSFEEYVKDPVGNSQGSRHIRDILEKLRVEGAIKMGLWDSSTGTTLPQAQPKICIVSAPTSECANGQRSETNVDIIVHALSMGTLHRAIPMTVGLALGVAAGVEGTLVWDIVKSAKGDRESSTSGSLKSESRASGHLVRIYHPSGIVDVGAQFAYIDGVDENGKTTQTVVVKSAKVVRTGRRLMRGEVWW